MGLEEITEEIVDDKDVVKRNIVIMSQSLDGHKPGCIEEDLVKAGICDVLANYHSWSSEKVKKTYLIELNYDWDIESWDVLVEA